MLEKFVLGSSTIFRQDQSNIGPFFYQYTNIAPNSKLFCLNTNFFISFFAFTFSAPVMEYNLSNGEQGTVGQTPRK